jgi:hypothetical protein
MAKSRWILELVSAQWRRAPHTKTCDYFYRGVLHAVEVNTLQTFLQFVR